MERCGRDKEAEPIAFAIASQIVTHPCQPTFAHGTVDTQEKNKSFY